MFHRISSAEIECSFFCRQINTLQIPITKRRSILVERRFGFLFRRFILLKRRFVLALIRNKCMDWLNALFGYELYLCSFIEMKPGFTDLYIEKEERLTILPAFPELFRRRHLPP